MTLVYGIESGKSEVVLSADAIAVMLRFRQKGLMDKESGGQLFAKFDGRNTTIMEATTPKLLDERARYGFIPSRWMQKLEIKAQHKLGNHFVGDWHTHPEPVPSPSREDINSMVDCFRKSHHEADTIFVRKNPGGSQYEGKCCDRGNGGREASYYWA